MRVKVKMPKLGLTMMEATVLEWRKRVGEIRRSYPIGAVLAVIDVPGDA